MVITPSETRQLHDVMIKEVIATANELETCRQYGAGVYNTCTNLRDAVDLLQRAAAELIDV